ncbi:MAG: hypothetical protein HZB51_31025 [Chloroflexi bacterium]|nr:hypothetical protein [Chloroflexota bacterium]
MNRSLIVTILVFFIALAGALFVQPNSTFAQSATPTPYRYYLPIVLRDPIVPPSATTSRYIQTLDPTKLYNQGCAHGTSNPTGIVVLDFGGPRTQNGMYGTKLVGISGFISTTQIADAVKWWLQGFWNCAPSNAHITVGIGTNNCAIGPGPNACDPGGGNVSFEHGQAWAQMVKSVNDWIITSTYASKLTIAGANDIELHWSSAQEARAWVDGFFSNAPNEIFALYNFGACDGCEYLASQNWVLPYDWKKEDVWYVSWGAQTSYPLPEIYLTSGVNASQWYLLSVWSYVNHGSSMNFSGSFTQWQACQERGCTVTDNTPEQGWTQLYDVLNSDARTAQPLNWATDITWQQ